MPHGPFLRPSVLGSAMSCCFSYSNSLTSLRFCFLVCKIKPGPCRAWWSSAQALELGCLRSNCGSVTYQIYDLGQVILMSLGLSALTCKMRKWSYHHLRLLWRLSDGLKQCLAHGKHSVNVSVMKNSVFSSSLETTHFCGQMFGWFFSHQAILSHQLVILQFNSNLTLSTWTECQIPQLKDSALQYCPSPLHRPIASPGGRLHFWPSATNQLPPRFSPQVWFICYSGS